MSTTIDNPTRESWLADRMGGLGGSDSAAALGQNDYKSPYALWAEKVGLIEPDDLSGVRRVRLGNKMEPIIAEEYEIETGRKVTLWPQHQITRHPDIDWLLCTLDATQVDEVKGPGILQMKAPGLRQIGKWGDAPPLMYQIQLQHEMAVAGAQWGSLCALIGHDLFFHDFDYDQRFVDVMIPALAEFWAMVKSKQSPPIDGSKSCADAIRKRFPHDFGDSVMLPDESVEWDAELLAAKAVEKQAKERIELYGNKLKAAIGSAAYGMLPSGDTYSYKSHTVDEHTVKAHSKRPLVRRK